MTARKRSKFQVCERHARLGSLPARRRAEFFVEGGPAGQAGCCGGRCRLWPGTDLFVADICEGELPLPWTEPTAIAKAEGRA